MPIFKMKMTDPIGGEYSNAFINGEMKEVYTFVYAPTEKGTTIRDFRKTNNIGLREAAKELGITAVTLSSIEQFKVVIEQDIFDSWIEQLSNYAKTRV